jgi:hypothetical protein
MKRLKNQYCREDDKTERKDEPVLSPSRPAGIKTTGKLHQQAINFASS